MKNFRTYLEQVTYVLSRFTDEDLRVRREEVVARWTRTGFSPVLIGEWIAVGMWNPSAAVFLWNSNILPAHLLEDRVSPALIEAVCIGETLVDDIVNLFFGGHLKTKNVETVARSYAERVACVLSHFTDEALCGQREEMVQQWIYTGFDPVLVAGWLSAGVWNPRVAVKLWNQGVSPVDLFDCQIPHHLMEEVCANQRDPRDVTEMVIMRR